MYVYRTNVTTSEVRQYILCFEYQKPRCCEKRPAKRTICNNKEPTKNAALTLSPLYVNALSRGPTDENLCIHENDLPRNMLNSLTQSKE